MNFEKVREILSSIQGELVFAECEQEFLEALGLALADCIEFLENVYTDGAFQLYMGIFLAYIERFRQKNSHDLMDFVASLDFFEEDEEEKDHDNHS